MCGVSGIELMVIVIAAVIFLGPDRLPEAMRTLGKLMREVRKVTGELSSVRDDFTKSMREENASINETVNRRASAGRAGQDVSDIDAIRAQRAAADAEAAVGDLVDVESAATDAAIEGAPSLATGATPVAGTPAVAPSPVLPGTPSPHAPLPGADELPALPASPAAKPPVQLRPATRSAATFSNPYRPSSSAQPPAPASGDTVPLEPGSHHLQAAKPASDTSSKAEVVQVTPDPKTDDGEQV